MDIVIVLNGQRHRQVLHKGCFSKKECKEKCSLYERCQRCCIDLCRIFFHDPRCHFVEEPVSEELEEAVNAYIGYAPEIDESSSVYGKRLAFKAGAEWQKEQFEKNRIEHCENITEEQYNLETGFLDLYIKRFNRLPTIFDAIEYGKTLGVQKR